MKQSKLLKCHWCRWSIAQPIAFVASDAWCLTWGASLLWTRVDLLLCINFSRIRTLTRWLIPVEGDIDFLNYGSPTTSFKSFMEDASLPCIGKSHIYRNHTCPWDHSNKKTRSLLITARLAAIMNYRVLHVRGL